jgi:hypothetical protein
MKDDLLAYLDDILRSGRDIKAFVAGYTFEGYSADELLRSRVQRCAARNVVSGILCNTPIGGIKKPVTRPQGMKSISGV